MAGMLIFHERAVPERRAGETKTDILHPFRHRSRRAGSLLQGFHAQTYDSGEVRAV